MLCAVSCRGALSLPNLLPPCPVSWCSPFPMQISGHLCLEFLGCWPQALVPRPVSLILQISTAAFSTLAVTCTTAAKSETCTAWRMWQCTLWSTRCPWSGTSVLQQFQQDLDPPSLSLGQGRCCSSRNSQVRTQERTWPAWSHPTSNHTAAFLARHCLLGNELPAVPTGTNLCPSHPAAPFPVSFSFSALFLL